MSKSPHYKNYWDEVRNWRVKLTDEGVSNYPVQESLETSWNILSCSLYTVNYKGKPHQLLSREDDERTAGTPLDAFNFYIDSGFYPPPEILLWLYDCFSYYLGAKGKVSLEHIFFGRETPSVGNESARRAADEVYRLFSAMVMFEKMGAEKNNQTARTQLQLAEHFLAGNYTFAEIAIPEKLRGTDPETFLRNWRRKTKNPTDT